MAAARSVIVRFTSSSTSTAAPAAARLASLRQRVLQAGSGVVKNPSNSDNGGARGAIARYFGAASTHDSAAGANAAQRARRRHALPTVRRLPPVAISENAQARALARKR